LVSMPPKVLSCKANSGLTPSLRLRFIREVSQRFGHLVRRPHLQTSRKWLSKLYFRRNLWIHQ
jgi:hypothetical protein